MEGGYFFIYFILGQKKQRVQAIVIRCSVVKVTPACPFANFPFLISAGSSSATFQPAHFPLYGVLLNRTDIRHGVRLTNDGITWVPRKL
jgi:hypothetical protein